MSVAMFDFPSSGREEATLLAELCLILGREVGVVQNQTTRFRPKRIPYDEPQTQYAPVRGVRAIFDRPDPCKLPIPNIDVMELHESIGQCGRSKIQSP